MRSSRRRKRRSKLPMRSSRCCDCNCDPWQGHELVPTVTCNLEHLKAPFEKPLVGIGRDCIDRAGILETLFMVSDCTKCTDLDAFPIHPPALAFEFALCSRISPRFTLTLISYISSAIALMYLLSLQVESDIQGPCSGRNPDGTVKGRSRHPSQFILLSRVCAVTAVKEGLMVTVILEGLPKEGSYLYSLCISLCYLPLTSSSSTLK
jgi:hypothetical protein